MTLSTISDNSLRGKGLHCCFVDFKNTFDMVPLEHLWKQMEELEVPSEYMLAISQIFEKVICCVHMSDRLSDFFNSTIGVKQGPTLTNSIWSMH